MTSHRRSPRARGASAAAEEERQRRAQRIRDLQDDERFGRLRTPLARRSLVVVGSVAAILSGAIAWVDPDGPVSVAAPTVFLAALGIAFLLNRIARHAAAAEDDALDERLVALRDRAFHRSYPVLVLGVLMALLALMLSLGDGVGHRHLQALFYAYGAAAAITPLALLVWSADEL